MKIEVNQEGEIVLKEVYSGVLMETGEGNQIGICMRDDTIEINVCPHGKHTNNWWRVNMQNGRVESMRCPDQPSELKEGRVKKGCVNDLPTTPPPPPPKGQRFEIIPDML